MLLACDHAHSKLMQLGLTQVVAVSLLQECQMEVRLSETL